MARGGDGLPSRHPAAVKRDAGGRRGLGVGDGPLGVAAMLPLDGVRCRGAPIPAMGGAVAALIGDEERLPAVAA